MRAARVGGTEIEEGGMSVRPAEYREWRKRSGKPINWDFVRKCLRYRQEARNLRLAGFRECRSWSCLPFDDQMGRRRIVETRIANEGRALWVKVSDKLPTSA
jgi:hypothetical protein